MIVAVISVISVVCVQALTISFVVTVTIYNCMVVYVTKYLSAIWHAILDNFRPISIWWVHSCVLWCVVTCHAGAWTWPSSI